MIKPIKINQIMRYTGQYGKSMRMQVHTHTPTGIHTHTHVTSSSKQNLLNCFLFRTWAEFMTISDCVMLGRIQCNADMDAIPIVMKASFYNFKIKNIKKLTLVTDR